MDICFSMLPIVFLIGKAPAVIALNGIFGRSIPLLAHGARIQPAFGNTSLSIASLAREGSELDNHLPGQRETRSQFRRFPP
jgi:hypothetical protein